MEDSKSSSEESGNKQENVNDDAGTGRSYECVFCKRGFNTAQALGGHMNIHRRDRARTKQPICPLISSQPLEDYSRSGGFYQSSAIHSALNSSFRETHRNYQTYFPTSSNEHQYGFHRDELHFQKIRPLSLFEETWRPSLSLRISPTHIEQRYEEKKEDKEEDGVDLELRLGHDP